jgi:hypothetical protein
MRKVFVIGTFVLIPILAASAQQQPPLRIVVVEGEGAVNIIQQQTAVRPLVEVRDRNNLPVAGASVTFTIGGGGQSAAFAGGAQTLTVTTNAAGQAAASSFSAVSSGAVQIQVQAAYQGQIATAAISQTNFATAAAAAQAGAGAGGGGGAGTAGGAAGGGGGGISGTTIGLIGGAVAGGAVAATQLSGQQDSDDVVETFNGSVSGQITVSSTFTPSVGPPSNCTFTRTITGSMQLNLKPNGTGDTSLQLTITEISAVGPLGCIFDPMPRGLSTGSAAVPVTGGPSAITFTHTSAAAQSVTVETLRFSGSLSGNTINGTLTLDIAPAPGANPRQSGSTTMAVTLTGPRP